MATTIVTKSGSGAPTASDLVAGELAVDLTNKRLYTEDSGGTILELGTNPASDVTFGDNTKAIFGAGSDLQIYHDGSDSYVKDAGVGYLNLLGTGRVVVGHPSNGDVYLNANYGGDVELFFNNSKKFETTATGIDVTGTVTADGLTVVGITTSSNGTYGTKLTYSNGNQSGIIDTFGNHNLEFRTNDDRAMNIASNGDISFYSSDGLSQALFWDASAESLGIGTSSPAKLIEAVATGAGSDITALQVRNNSASTSTSTSIRFVNSTVNTSTAGGAEVSAIRNASDGGALTFKTAANTTATLTERMRIDASGHAIIPAGVTLGTATGVYNAAKTLDDYEEGTWTPAVTGSTTAGSATYTIQQGNYTKIGNVVYWQVRLAYTGHTGTGNTIISFPFTSANRYAAGNYSYRDGLTVPASEDLKVYIPPSATYIGLYSVALGTDLVAGLVLDTAVSDLSISGVCTVV